VRLECFQRRDVDVHHTATGDGHSAGYEVILKISIVIRHDKTSPNVGEGGKF
jgi:hypothetical protein